jgi:hypothetical protein
MIIALKPHRGDIKKSRKNQKIYINAKNGKYFQRFELIEPFEQPFIPPNDLNLCLVSRKARKGAKT